MLHEFYISKCGVFVESITTTEEAIKGYVAALGPDYSYEKRPA